MKALCWILCGILFLVINAAHAADLKKGVQAFQRGDYAAALAEFKPLAEHGNIGAQENLAEMYYGGQGVPQDSVQAATWYRKAAEQGLAQAQFNLGEMYYGGQGVPQDYAQAAIWHRKAAEQGLAPAQRRLGFMYEYGQGVPQDYAQALIWYRNAAEQGEALAEVNLARMYVLGEGVRTNFVAAYALFNLASATAGHNQNMIAGLRAGLMKGMSPVQIEAGQALTRDMQNVGVLKALDAHLANQ